MTVVTVTLREYLQLRIYSYPPATMSWQGKVLYSQGTLRAKRSELIYAEWERVDTYQQKGDLASFESVLAYLNGRESIAGQLFFMITMTMTVGLMKVEKE